MRLEWRFANNACSAARSLPLLVNIGHFKQSRDVHTVVDRAVDRAIVGVETEDALGHVTQRGVNFEVIRHDDAADDQRIAVLADFAACFGVQPAFTGGNFTRFQRATKGAGQSPGGGGDQIIECGRVRVVLAHVRVIMLGNL